MAKEQKRGNREAKKPKGTGKAGKSGPKYLAAGEMTAPVKNAMPQAPKKK